MKLANVKRGAFKRWKHIAHALSPRPDDQQLLFIVGCQRSGTTLLSQIFERDMSTRSYPEVSELTSDDRESGIRLNAPDRLRSQLARINAPLIVLKPIVESQNTRQLLDAFPGSKALWIYRDFRDVAASNVRRFGAEQPFRDLAPIVEGRPGNWRSEFVPDDVAELVRDKLAGEISPHDAAVLFWWVRNRLFVDLDLEGDERVGLCRYESLAADPGAVTRSIYDFLGRPFPGERIGAKTHARSVSKGASVELDGEIEALATSLLADLDSLWARQQADAVPARTGPGRRR